MTKKTMQKLSWATREQQKALLVCLNKGDSPHKTLEALNVIAETYGVEIIETGQWSSNCGTHGTLLAAYLNTGCTYTATIVYRYDTARHWDIVDIGTLKDRWERRHIVVD